MHILLVRHAIAAPLSSPAERDEDRQLTDLGKRRFRIVAEALRRIAPKPSTILTSPLIRARQTAEILAKTLEANEARGRRKFVRALCPPGAGQCVVQYEGATLRGEVTDLSSAGMAIRFQGGSSPRVGTVLSDISLNIKGQRLSPSGVIVARRADEGGAGGVHVVMFDPYSFDAARKDKLKTLVFKLNQQAMDAILDRA